MAIKIYTKTGDKGRTSLLGGTKVPKSDLRIECYGTVDELNSYIGLVYDLISDEHSKKILKEIVLKSVSESGTVMKCVEKYSQGNRILLVSKTDRDNIKQFCPLSFLHEIDLYSFIIFFIRRKTMP